MVERLDVQRRLLAEFLHRKVRELDMPAHREVGAVDLEQKPGAMDRVVLGPHRVGDRRKIRLVAAVVLVREKQGDDSGRSRAHKDFFDLFSRGSLLEVFDIDFEVARVRISDWPVAGGSLKNRRHGREKPRRIFREVREISKSRSFAPAQTEAFAAETGHPILNVGRVARLAHLTIVDYIDAGLELLADGLDDRRADARVKSADFVWLAGFPGGHQAQQIVGTRQAAGVSGEDMPSAALLSE